MKHRKEARKLAMADTNKDQSHDCPPGYSINISDRTKFKIHAETIPN